MKLRQVLYAGLLFSVTTLGVNGVANATMVIFDGNTGPGAKAGTAETGVGQGTNGTDPYGDPITFSQEALFKVTAGLSNVNLNGNSFNKKGDVAAGYRAYQDITPEHGGLGAVPRKTFEGDNLDPNVGGDINRDEVLFFDFKLSTILNTVFFNGDHQEHVQDTRPNSEDALFNIFVSDDGASYKSVFGGHKRPTGKEYLDTNLTSGYQYYAVSSTGLLDSPGGYVEAINFDTITGVPAPLGIALLGLGLLGLGISRRRKITSATTSS